MAISLRYSPIDMGQEFFDHFLIDDAASASQGDYCEEVHITVGYVQKMEKIVSRLHKRKMAKENAQRIFSENSQRLGNCLRDMVCCAPQEKKEGDANHCVAESCGNDRPVHYDSDKV